MSELNKSSANKMDIPLYSVLPPVSLKYFPSQASTLGSIVFVLHNNRDSHYAGPKILSQGTGFT